MDIEEIFKSNSQYYPQLKIINLETPIRHEVVHISPTVARDMLKFSRRGKINTDLSNRRVNRSTVKKFTEDMNEGRWCLTGEPIIIGHDGVARQETTEQSRVITDLLACLDGHPVVFLDIAATGDAKKKTGGDDVQQAHNDPP